MPPQKKKAPSAFSKWLARLTDRSNPATKLYQDLLLHVSLFTAVVFSMCVCLARCSRRTASAASRFRASRHPRGFALARAPAGAAAVRPRAPPQRARCPPTPRLTHHPRASQTRRRSHRYGHKIAV